MAKQMLNEEFRRMQKLAGIITESQMNEEDSDELMVAFKNSPNMIPWEKIEKTYKKSGLTGDEFFAGFEDEFRKRFEGKPVSKEAYNKFYNSRATGGQDDRYIMVNWIDFTNPELASKLSNQIAESQMNEEEHSFDPKALGDESYNAIDPVAPDWRDYEGYEMVLEDYFDTYNLEDPKEFALEVYGGGEVVNDLAVDIAKRAGFKGDISDLIDDENFNNYCNALAKEFLLLYGKDMGVVDENDSKWKKEMDMTKNWLSKAENDLK